MTLTGADGFNGFYHVKCECGSEVELTFSREMGGDSLNFEANCTGCGERGTRKLCRSRLRE